MGHGGSRVAYAARASFLKLRASRFCRTRYRNEVRELRISIQTHREMWEHLVRDSEQQLVSLREQIATVASERRDALARPASALVMTGAILRIRSSVVFE